MSATQWTQEVDQTHPHWDSRVLVGRGPRCFSLAPDPLLPTVFNPKVGNTHRGGTSDGWVSSSEAIPKGLLPRGGVSQVWEGWVGRQLRLWLTWQIFNSSFPSAGHRSSTDQSLWGSGHSPDVDAEILPALISQTGTPSSSSVSFQECPSL